MWQNLLPSSEHMFMFSLPNLLVIEQCFFLTINQRTILLVMAYQPSEQNNTAFIFFILVSDHSYNK